jgi:TonB family protein
MSTIDRKKTRLLILILVAFSVLPGGYSSTHHRVTEPASERFIAAREKTIADRAPLVEENTILDSAELATPEGEHTAGQGEAPTSPELSEAARLHQQVISLYNRNKYDEALPIARKVLEIREKALGADHELVATSLNNVAAILMAQQKYADSEKLYRRSLAILEKRAGPESEKLTRTLESLALLRFGQRDSGGAEKLYRRALTITERAFGTEHPETGRVVREMGRLYERTARYSKALEYYKRSLAIAEKSVGSENSGLVDLLYSCACALIENDQPEESKSYMERAEKIARSAPVKKSAGVLQGMAIRRYEPEYPPSAKSAGVSGRVLVEVTVDECGRVINARALSGPAQLVYASVETAKRWRFTPTILEGRRVKVIGTVTFSFNL